MSRACKLRHVFTMSSWRICLGAILGALLFQLCLHRVMRFFLTHLDTNMEFQITLKREMSEFESKLQDEVLLSQNDSCCSYGLPCMYPETVDFRIIVITYNRATSLVKLLRTLNTVLLDGDTGRLEIWIDRDKYGMVDAETLEAARHFRWTQGPTRVHVQDKRVGIYGQWIYTWTPMDYSRSSQELALILEDDLSISPYIYRWIKAVHQYYGPRADFVGCSLTSDELVSHDGRFSKLVVPEPHTVFMYKCIGTWGFAPAPHRWRDFQEWFRLAHKQPDFHPYVPGIIPTEWYQGFEKAGTEDSMWEMWLIYYTYQEKLFTVYNNLRAYNRDRNECLSINRREVGLHNSEKGREDYCSLLSQWRNEYVKFPAHVWKLDWNGKKITSY